MTFSFKSEKNAGFIILLQTVSPDNTPEELFLQAIISFYLQHFSGNKHSKNFKLHFEKPNF